MVSIDTAKSADVDKVAGPDVAIGLDPRRLGRHRARLTHCGVPVWALIAHLQGVDWDVAHTARDYDLPEEAVRAAIAYDEADPTYIDAFLLLNRDALES